MAKNAFSIAKESLRKCYDKQGIVAGRTHFNYYWARDSFYASWGSLEIGDTDIVRQNLSTFLKNIDEKGQVPLRIGASNLYQWLALFGVKTRNDFRPEYSQDKGRNPAIDPNLLFLITLGKYVEKTDDISIVKKNIEKIHKIIDWLEGFEKQGLIYAGNYSTWQDILKKKGFVLYTNVLYYQALVSASEFLKKADIKNEFLEKSNLVKQKINEEFYDKKLGFYIDYFNEKMRSEIFSSDGNFFAIIFDVADKKQADSILKKAEKIGISKDVPSYTNYPRYGFPEVYAPLYLAGMQDYNDYGVCWTWLGCLHSMALSNAGKKIEARKVLDNLSELIIKDKDVYETYEKNGKPLKRLFYSSEHPFAWSASFYITAEKELKK